MGFPAQAILSRAGFTWGRAPRWKGLLPLMGLALVFMACASTERLEMAPLHFKAVRDADGVHVQVQDPESIYHEGTEAMTRGDFGEARRHFEALLRRGDAGSWGEAAWQPLVRVYEELGLWGEAVVGYERLIAGAGQARQRQGFRLRRLRAWQRLEAWAEIQEEATAFVRDTEARPIDRMIAWARLGRAYEGQGAWAHAERSYQEVLGLYREHMGALGAGAPPVVSMAQMRLGGIYHRLLREVGLWMPESRMGRGLELKSNLYLTAQRAYMQTMRLRHPHWSLAAGFSLGELHEAMHEGLLGAEIPAYLTEAQRVEYLESVEEKVRPLLLRAQDVYERTVMLGERLGIQEGWVTESERRLEAIDARLRARSRAQGAPD